MKGVGVKAQKINTGLWWCPYAYAVRSLSGRWIVEAESLSLPDVHTGPREETVRAPGSCTSARQAVCWAAHSKAWQRIRVHSQGIALMSRIKAKYPESATRADIFGKLAQKMRQEFLPGYMYSCEDAQNILARLILGEQSARRDCDSYLPVKQLHAQEG